MANLCQKHLRAQGKPYPRTCAVCRLGPCVYDTVPAKMSKPSEKHMEAAREIAKGWYRVPFEDEVGVFARALANAEREGMKRAAAIAIGEAHANCDVAEQIAKLILSEAGED